MDTIITDNEGCFLTDPIDCKFEISLTISGGDIEGKPLAVTLTETFTTNEAVLHQYHSTQKNKDCTLARVQISLSH